MGGMYRVWCEGGGSYGEGGGLRWGVGGSTVSVGVYSEE